MMRRCRPERPAAGQLDNGPARGWPGASGLDGDAELETSLPRLDKDRARDAARSLPPRSARRNASRNARSRNAAAAPKRTPGTTGVPKQLDRRCELDLSTPYSPALCQLLVDFSGAAGLSAIGI